MATAVLKKEEITFDLSGCPTVDSSDGAFNPLRAVLVYRGNSAIIDVKGTKIGGVGVWRSARFSMGPHQNYPLAPKWLIEAMRSARGEEAAPVERCGAFGSVTVNGRFTCSKPLGHFHPPKDLHKYELEE